MRRRRQSTCTAWLRPDPCRAAVRSHARLAATTSARVAARLSAMCRLQKSCIRPSTTSHALRTSCSVAHSPRTRSSRRASTNRTHTPTASCALAARSSTRPLSRASTPARCCTSGASGSWRTYSRRCAFVVRLSAPNSCTKCVYERSMPSAMLCRFRAVGRTGKRNGHQQIAARAHGAGEAVQLYARGVVLQAEVDLLPHVLELLELLAPLRRVARLAHAPLHQREPLVHREDAARARRVAHLARNAS